MAPHGCVCAEEWGRPAPAPRDEGRDALYFSPNFLPLDPPELKAPEHCEPPCVFISEPG